ncbi:MAG: hypothetical protein ABIU58_12340 [Ramlibacter sp.]
MGATLRDGAAGLWQVCKFAVADAWWINGTRVQVRPDATIRVASGAPGGRSIHLDLQDVDRPVAFALPLAPRQFEPLYTFDPQSLASMEAVLKAFEGWMSPMIAQFALASSIFDQESVLGSASHHVTANGVLIAVVNMRGDCGVLPTATIADFEHAMWQRLPATGVPVPEHFARSSLTALMWQFAMRTLRDVLPKRYYIEPIYFRRPPRLSQRLLTDAHLLLMRELAGAPTNFKTLQQSTGLGEAALARDLAALYFVGAITTNAKRAAAGSMARQPQDADSGISQNHSIPFTGPDSMPPSHRLRKDVAAADLTAPAPLRPN